MMTYSAGCRLISLQDPDRAASFPAFAMYPAHAPEQPAKLGAYAMSVAIDAPAIAGPLPLAVVSHGTGGSHLVYRTLAAHLARNGFLVVAPEHPGNNRNNNDLANTAANLANRPRHLSMAIDWALGGNFGALADAGRVAVIGHSMGGYTALALAGGQPLAFPHETPDRKPAPVAVTADTRAKALVLLAPATAWFQEPGALSQVRLPILLWTAEHDTHTNAAHTFILKRGLPDAAPIEHRIAKGGGHFAFLSPFPAEMVKPFFPPSQDPPGFDRAAFHEELNAGVLEFLRKHLTIY